MEFNPGATTWSVSFCASGPLEAAGRTLVHEIGHHLHHKADAENDIVEALQIGDRGVKARLITEYAGNDWSDYFAESLEMVEGHPHAGDVLSVLYGQGKRAWLENRFRRVPIHHS